MRLAICGPGRAGKDEAANWFNDHTSIRYSGFSTSMAITPHAARRFGISEEEAFARRHQDREVWYELGNELRKHDKTFLIRQTLKHGDIAVGSRDGDELQVAIEECLVDLAIWIDRDVPEDPTQKYGPELCHVIMQNRGTLEEFHVKLLALSKAMGVLARKCCFRPCRSP